MKKKLLFINGHLKTGGCERSLTDLLCHMDYEAYDVDLLLVEDLGEYLEEIPAEVNVIYYDLKKAFGEFKKCMLNALKNRDWLSIRFRLNHMYCQKYGIKKISGVRRLFKEVKNHYDAIVAYRPGVCTELAAFAFSADVKISWWHHGEYYDFGDVLPTYKEMSKIVAVSQGSAQIVKDHFPEIADKVSVIPNMVPVQYLVEKSNEFEVRNERKLLLVSIGRFSPEKNMFLCPEVGKILRDKEIDYVWFLIGDGEQLEKTKELVRDYNLDDNFIFTGALQNPYPYIVSSDILVHPSTVESQGITILEAMALGVPVVVVESNGPKEFIESGINGYLVSNDSKSVADKVLSINNNTSIGDVICEAKKTVSRFEPNMILKEFYELIR